jgi:hypothetical protein
LTGPAGISAGISTGLAPAIAAYCRNCRFALGERPGNYCPNCGQETASHPPSPGQQARHFFTEYMTPSGRLVRSLALLVFCPGELTRRYLAGRKRSYVPPLRLYFAASLIFFLAVKLFGAGNLVRSEAVDPGRDEAAATSAAGDDAKTGLQASRPGPIGNVKFDAGEGGWDAPFLATFKCSAKSVQCLKVRKYMQEKYGDAPLRVVAGQVRDRVMSYAPNALFAMLPVFALFTRVLYWRRRMTYGEHFIYAMHLHAFTFLILLAIALLPATIAEWLPLAGMIYFAVAMQRVFGGRWWATMLRYGLIGICYPVLLSFVILLTLAAAVFI